MRCSACGHSAPDGSRFCPSCGRPLLTTSDATVAVLDGDATRLSATDATIAPVAPRASRYGPGDLLADRYRIVRPLGRGGMGEVYLVDDLRLHHQVALKFLPPALAVDKRRLDQFHNEVRIARQVSHPNVCRVYDIGEADGQLFLSMEYVAGEDLAAALERVGKYSDQDAVELARQICVGLGAAHEKGVLHRDLKPANIMINRAGRAQVMDFGLAVAGEVDHIAEGTPAYMAPEQLLGKEVTVQSDLYALGLIMYELFTGQRAFNPDTPLNELVNLRTSRTIVAPAAVAYTINTQVNNAILACLEADPKKRPSSAQAVSAMLQTVLLDASTTWRRLGQLGLAAGGCFLIFGVVGAARAVHGWNNNMLLPLVGGLLLGIAYVRYQLQWDVKYKGHSVRFKVHPVWGERLYIDDVLVDRGRPGINITLRGTIESGQGAGERITSLSKAGLFTVSCVIVAESFRSSE